MTSPTQFCRLTPLALALALAPLCALGNPPLPNLQLVTSVVSINVPATAFNKSSGVALVTVSRGLVLQVTADASWKLQLRAPDPVFSVTGQKGTPTQKSVSDMSLRNTSGGQLIIPSASFVQIGNGGNTHGPQELSFDVLLNATTADSPGLYTTTLELGFR